MTAWARRRWEPVEVIAVAGGASVLAGTWVVVALQDRVPSWEARAFHAVNDWPDGLWPVLWPVMQIGNLMGSLAVTGIVGLCTRRPRLTAAAFLATQITYWGSKVVKHAVGRERPADLLAGVHLREHASGLGYVSGHTAGAFALATVLAPAVPSAWRWAVVGIAGVVGLARIYSGADMPLDVIGGAGFGVLAGITARWALGLGGAGVPPAAPEAFHDAR